MIKLAASIGTLVLAACAAAPSQNGTPAGVAEPGLAPSTHPHEVRGVAVDPTGAEARVRVALVDSGGSTSMNYGGGPFALDSHSSEPYTLVASTEDGRIDWIENVSAGSEGHALSPAAQGGFLTVELDGRDSVRVGIGQGDTRTADKTVRGPDGSRFVVPSGDVWVEAYAWEDGKRRIFDRITLSVEPKAELVWRVDAGTSMSFSLETK